MASTRSPGPLRRERTQPSGIAKRHPLSLSKDLLAITRAAVPRPLGPSSLLRWRPGSLGAPRAAPSGGGRRCLCMGRAGTVVCYATLMMRTRECGGGACSREIPFMPMRRDIGAERCMRVVSILGRACNRFPPGERLDGRSANRLIDAHKDEKVDNGMNLNPYRMLIKRKRQFCEQNQKRI